MALLLRRGCSMSAWVRVEVRVRVRVEVRVRVRVGAAPEARLQHVRVAHDHLDVPVVRVLEGVGHLRGTQAGCALGP